MDPTVTLIGWHERPGLSLGRMPVGTATSFSWVAGAAQTGACAAGWAPDGERKGRRQP